MTKHRVLKDESIFMTFTTPQNGTSKESIKFPDANWLIFIGVVLLMALMGSCTTPVRQVNLFGPAKLLKTGDYQEVLDTWTRSAKIYRDLDSKMFLTATFHAPEFRRVFALAFPDIYGHGAEITRRELVELSGGVEHYLNFFVSAYTHKVRWNDLAKEDSIWRLELEGSNGVIVSPNEIIQVKIDANLKAVYPYIGAFDMGYLVRFRLTDPMNRLIATPKSEFLKMRIVSALGKAELEWKLTPSSPQKAPE